MDALANRPIWICWCWSLRNGKQTKTPIAASGCPTGTNEEFRCTWVTKAEAEMAAASRGYSGIGFVVPDGYFFLDIDHRGQEDPFVQLMLQRFASYAEMSVSGSGIHIYGKCDMASLPTYVDKDGKTRLNRNFYMKSPNDVELYFGGITNRFAVYTGNAIHDVPLCDCTDALLQTLDEYMRRHPKTNIRSVTPRPGNGDSDAKILEDLRKAKNGVKFSALYDRGDMSGYCHSDGTPDQSRADCALCALIAFRVGPDVDTIDRLFRGSALYRQKWDRSDYRTSTIDAGINACNGVFYGSKNPTKSVDSDSNGDPITDIPDFVQFDDKGRPYVNSALLAQYAKEHLHYILVRNDGREGIRIYVYEHGVYRHYAVDMLHAIIKGYIEKYDLAMVKMQKVTEAANILLADLNYVPQNALNADENIINFRNGVLRLSDMVLLPHDPSVLSTIQLPCDWLGQDAPTPVFDSYLAKLMDDDPDMITLCLEIIGVVISNVHCYRLKKAAFFVGPGNTGKSLLKSLVERIIGTDNYVGIDLRDIEARFGTGTIYGKRLAGSADMSYMSVSELKTFKSLTGGDAVMAEFKGLQQFSYIFGGFLWFSMNRLPRFGGDDGRWVFDRIMVITCPNIIPQDEQDKQLLDKMFAERDGIVNKAVMALTGVISRGYRFSEPDKVLRNRQTYMEDTNTAVAFWIECMEERELGKPVTNENVTTNIVYQCYKAWCQDNYNGYAKSVKEFRDAIADHLGVDYNDLIIHTRDGSIYAEYTLTVTAKKQYIKTYGYSSKTVQM